MDLIATVTKDCSRNDCAIQFGTGASTCMWWTPTYDRHGNQVGLGDQNITTKEIHCNACGKRWWAHTQYGNTKIEAF